MARDDWRIRIELEEEQARGFLDRLGIDISSRAKELAEELELDRLAVSHDADTVFVYAASAAEAAQARTLVDAELEESGVDAREVRLEHWLDDDDRWDSEPDLPDVEEELVARGFAPWEVRVECESHEQADDLADQLEADGYEVVRRWTYLIVGTRTREEADELAKRVGGKVEAGGELVYEVMPRNPVRGVRRPRRLALARPRRSAAQDSLRAAPASRTSRSGDRPGRCGCAGSPPARSSG